MSVSVLIQHRAGRDEALNRLLEKLPPAVEVVVDDEPELNPWRGYRKCLEREVTSSHVAILQDDTLVCRNFLPAVERIAEANPETIVSLFLSTVPRRTCATARATPARYVDLHPYDLVHVVGLLWPISRREAFLSWIDVNHRRLPRETISDDANVSRWVRMSRERIRVAIPNLVQHPDDVPSIVNGHRVQRGKDSGRTSAFWIGERDPLDFDWS